MEGLFEHLLKEFQLPFTSSIAVFTVILFIILVSPLVLKRIGIPGIVILILSGLVVGPYGLNILERTIAIDLFATIGLLYIMFIAGLEIDLKDFGKTRNKSITFGFFTFALPLLIGYPVCLYVLGMSIKASLLTSSMFATHTLVSYTTVSKFGITKNEAVAVSVGGTILTDTAVLVLLAFMMGNEHAGGIGMSFWINLILFLGIFSIILFVLVPWLTRWFFTKLESERYSHFIYVLLIVFIAAFLTRAANLEPIIGAFFAGLALNKLIPHNSPLMERIEFIGNALFIPIFLISVGMLVDLRVVLNGPWALIVALVLTVVALIGKWLAAFVTSLLLKFSSDQRNLIFGLSSSHAAATLAVILVGFKSGILDENILNGTILLILITCLFSSVVTERASKRIATHTEIDLPERKTSVQKILIPIANIQNLEFLLGFSILIRDPSSKNSIKVLSITGNDDQVDGLQADSQSTINSLLSANKWKVNVEAVTRVDVNVASGIARASQELEMTHIIQGWPLRIGMKQRLLGEHTENIVHQSDRNIFFCQFHSSIESCRDIHIYVPPLMVLEFGFIDCFRCVTNAATKLKCELTIYCNEKSKDFITSAGLLGDNTSVLFKSDFDTFWKISTESLPVVFIAREGSISYTTDSDNIAKRMEVEFGQNRILVYPQQYTESTS